MMRADTLSFILPLSRALSSEGGRGEMGRAGWGPRAVPLERVCSELLSCEPVLTHRPHSPSGQAGAGGQAALSWPGSN